MRAPTPLFWAGLVGAVLLFSIVPGGLLAQEEATSLERARQAYAAGEYGKVITGLEGALVHSSAYNEEDLATIHLYLGLAYLAFDRADRAHAQFLEAFRLDPDLEVDAEFRSPEAEELLQRARWVVEEERADSESGTETPEVKIGQAIDIPAGPTGKTRWGGVWRSTLIPGWGQHYGDRRIRGYALLACEIAALGGALFATKERNDAFDSYRAAREEDGGVTPPVAHLRDEYHSWDDTRRTLLIVAGGVWVVNILESLLNDPSVPREERAMGDWRFGGVQIAPDRWEVRLSRGF